MPTAFFFIGGTERKGKGIFPVPNKQYETSLPTWEHNFFLFPETGIAWSFDWTTFLNNIEILVRE